MSVQVSSISTGRTLATKISLVLAIIASLASLVFIVGWVINTIIAIGVIIKSEIGIFEGYGALSYILSVDISTVTTAVLMVTALCFTRGMWLLFLGKHKVSSPNEHFPFWRTYKTTYVYLGLIGTLFGFIIAFGRISPSPSLSDVDKLLQALGTALWSTFAAIIMAFVICPLLERPFVSKIIDVSVAESITQIGEAFRGLSEEAIKAKDTLKTLNQEIEVFELNQNAIIKLSALEDRINSINEEIGQIKDKLRGLDKNTHDISQLDQRVGKLILEFKGKDKRREIIDKITEELKKSMKELD